MTMNTHLLIIDPQNDFCDIPASGWPAGERPTLPVAGAAADMERLADFIHMAGARLSGITVTLDSHPVVAIERPTFWLTGEGAEVAPFTSIAAAQVASGEFRPRNPALLETVIGLLHQLEAAGRYQLMVWPVHCVTGTWGHNIHAKVAQALSQWERQSLVQVRKVLKGEYPLVEHYGVFEAETPLADVQATQFNSELARHVCHGVDRLLFAGEALSHCVRASVEQLMRFLDATNPTRRPALALLSDCSSSVAGFEQAGLDFLNDFRAAGGEVLTSRQAPEWLNT